MGIQCAIEGLEMKEPPDRVVHIVPEYTTTEFT